MEKPAILLAVCMLCCASSTVFAQTRPPSDLIARVRDGNGADLGEATLTKAPKGVLLEVRLKGLPPGPRGLHFHGAPSCNAPNFVSSGPHQNSEARNHGFLSPSGYHTGDLPNVYVGTDGTAQMDVFLPGAGLTPGQKGAIVGDQGVSLLVKSAADDYFSDPTGNSGARLACGVFMPPAALADAELARREADLAAREAELARKEAALQARAAAAPVVIPPPAATPQPAFTPSSAAPQALPATPVETAVGLPPSPQTIATPLPASLPDAQPRTPDAPSTGAQIIGPVPSPTLSAPQSPSIKRGPLQVPEDEGAPPAGTQGTY